MAGDTNQEALLIHIVRVTRLNIVLGDFVAQEVEIQAVFSPWISLVAVVVHTNSPLRDKMDAVSVDKAGNPAFADRVRSYSWRKILYHTPCRR